MRITERRLRRLIRSILLESLDGTSWSDDKGNEVTLRDILEYFKDNNIKPKSFNTNKFFYKISDGKEVLNIIEKGGDESRKRVEKASLDYPVIVVKKEKDIKYVLDGNHRLQKAKDNNENKIKVYILDLDNKSIPGIFAEMF